MIVGFVLIIAGVLLALYPPLLSLIVSAVLILQGVLCVVIALQYRRAASRHRVQIIDTLLRY